MKRYAIREVIRFLEGDGESLLVELRREGLFTEDEVTPGEAEELRVAALLVRDLGVNPAGVEVALHLRRRLLCLEERMRAALHELDAPSRHR